MVTALRLLLFALPWLHCLADNPAASLAVSQKGLDYAASLAQETLNARTQSLSIPDFTLTDYGFEFKLRNIVFHNVQVGDSKLSTASGNVASLALNGISATCQADWSFRLQSKPHEPSGHGTVVIQVGGGSHAHASVLLEQRDGKPHLTSQSVVVKIEITDLHFYGGISSYILTLFRGPVRLSLEAGLRGPVERQVSRMINDDANHALDSFSLTVPLPFPAPFNIAEIDFALLQVSTTDSCAALALKGESYQIGNHTEAPYPPPVGLPLYDADLSARMAEVILHPYALESLGSVFIGAGVAKLGITNDMWPKDIPLKLDTTTLLTVAPTLYREYPHTPLHILARVSGAPPTLNFGDGGPITVNGAAAFDFYVVPKPGEDKYAFTVGCPLTASAETTMVNQTISGKLELLACPLELIENDTGGRVYVMGLKELVDFAITTILIPYVNDQFSSGYPLPSIQGVSFQDSVVTTRGGFLVVSSDVLYKPAKALEELATSQPVIPLQSPSPSEAVIVV